MFQQKQKQICLEFEKLLNKTSSAMSKKQKKKKDEKRHFYKNLQNVMFNGKIPL
jgi:hypothetical protein